MAERLANGLASIRQDPLAFSELETGGLHVVSLTSAALTAWGNSGGGRYRTRDSATAPQGPLPAKHPATCYDLPAQAPERLTHILPTIKLPNNKAPIWLREKLNPSPRPETAMSATLQPNQGTTATGTLPVVTESSVATTPAVIGEWSEKCTDTTSLPAPSTEQHRTLCRP